MTDPVSSTRLGLAGRLAATFQGNPLTPVLAILGLLLGLVAVLLGQRLFFADPPATASHSLDDEDIILIQMRTDATTG